MYSYTPYAGKGWGGCTEFGGNYLFWDIYYKFNASGYPKFLTLPLKDASAKVVNGWYYCKSHAAIGTIHSAVDYQADYDEEIIAAADGVAMTSSQYASGSGYGNFLRY